MGCTPENSEAGQLFALLAFVPGALGVYLNSLRSRLVPGCQFKSHVTLLPPRVLGGSASALSEALASRLESVEPFEVGLGPVEVFPATGVIYLGLRTGGDALRQLHAVLAQGEFAYEEPYEFHPHVTLAQDFPLPQSEDLVRSARSLWEEWRGDRSFMLDRVSFVQGADLSTWETVSEHELTRSRRPRTG